MKKVLLTTNHFAELKGSEITILEHAEYFSNKGYFVDVFTNIYSELIKKELSIATSGNFFLTDNASYRFYLKDYEYIWIQHQLIPNSILEDLTKEENNNVKFIFAHLSSFIHLEFPWLYNIEEILADVSLVISEEAKKILENYKLKTSIELYRNPTNIKWYNLGLHNTKKINEINNILIVSNHIPIEVKEAINELKNYFNIDIIGDGYTKDIRVNPEIINKYDVIFTIGKTVQYGILLNKIIYCYDHFGGPGFLNHFNFEKARYHNFSGRGFNKKTPKEIINEFKSFKISENFFFNEIIKKEFVIDYKLEELLKLIKTNKNKKISPTLCLKSQNLLEMYRGVYRTYEYYKSLLNSHKLT